MVSDPPAKRQIPSKSADHYGPAELRNGYWFVYWLAAFPFRVVVWVAMDAVVDRIAFDWVATGFDDQILDAVHRQALGRGGSRVVIDQFMTHRAVDVIGSVSQRRLRRLDTQHDPVRFNMLDVI